MKRLLLFLVTAACLNITFAQQSLTKEERNKVIDHLKSSQSELLKTVKGLSEEQLNFKPEEGAWSVAECMEHIAISENSIFGAFQMAMQGDPDPSLRSEVKMSDDQVLGFIQSRESKVKTRKEFEPSGKFKDYDGSLAEFKDKRKLNMKYIKATKEDLRNRYFDFPFGKLDAYQVILFMSGHTKRHTDQIKEVMASANFPS